MPQAIRQEAEPVNADSFLDIVASVVCIMLIMVLMIGMRIKNTPVDAPLSPEAAQAHADLEKQQGVEQTLYGDVLRVDAQVKNVERETVARRMQRDALATAVAALDEHVRARRATMDAEAQGEFDLTHGIAEAHRQLDDLRRRRVEADRAEAAPVVVESYPTPISRVVDDHEIHFQLRAGCLAHVPLDTLVKQFKAEAQRQVYKLRDQPEYTDTVGPEGGFRLRYTLERKDISAEIARTTGRAGAYVQLKRWTLIPVSNELGEPVDVALGPGSAFREVLAKGRAGRHTVTIWIYPDSFDAYRQIRKEMFRLGFAVAARPLPDDAPISGSPEGSKSAAE